jgi:GDPmannose 4,6-dehydratase
MSAIILGAGGQDGYYLSQLLLADGLQVIKVSRSENFLHVNIADWEEMKELVRINQPDYVFHLAAQSTTSHSTWQENHNTISTSTLYLLEAVRLFSPRTKIFLSGSGLQFKNDGKPIKETDPFDASSIYAVNRIYTAYAARYYRKLGIRVYVGYFFNHDSPLRTDRHVSKKITEGARRIAAGSQEKIRLGDISVKKEWGFAGDVVKGAWQLVKQDKIFEATIGTGEAYSIMEWLKICFRYFDLNWEKYIIEDQNYKAEYAILVSNPSTIFSLGWQPAVPFDKLAQMMLV